MQTEKAEIFNLFVESAMTDFDKYQNRDKKSKSISENEKQKYDSKAFRTHFDNFIVELKVNINTYQDIHIVEDYVEAIFQYLININLYHEEQNRWIIETGYEVEFLIKLKKDIEYYINEIKACTLRSDLPFFTNTLKYYFETEMNKKLPVENKPNDVFVKAPEPEYQLDKRFDFNALKVESDELTKTIDKINLINDRLFDFEQWQLQNDTLIHDRDFGNYYELTVKYYSKFEDLCAVELRRINKMVEIEQRLNSQTPISVEQTPPFKWNSSDTDFLELFAALYQNESIVRADGKPLTRKEMLEYFQSILGLQIKYADSTLNKATNRKINMTPFIDSIKTAFEIYAKEKENKLESRR